MGKFFNFLGDNFFSKLLFSETCESGDGIVSYLRITLYLEFESFDFFK